ncbi:ABC-2 type transporter-like protein 5 [Elsinoe fawcettii]|nr:ABC-2 type transporter-like protein 5 [Elsinoe fawcettii]
MPSPEAREPAKNRQSLPSQRPPVKKAKDTTKAQQPKKEASPPVPDKSPRRSSSALLYEKDLERLSATITKPGDESYELTQMEARSKAPAVTINPEPEEIMPLAFSQLRHSRHRNKQHSRPGSRSKNKGHQRQASSWNALKSLQTLDFFRADQRADNLVADLPLSLGDKTMWNPFSESPGAQLDPTNEAFSAKHWMWSILQLRDPGKNPRRTAGIAFRDLSISAPQLGSDYQGTVGNALLRASHTLKKALGLRQNWPVQILKDFEGMVKPGEMLLVLGAPGAGCSTFLKTITGQSSGIRISENASLNYQGLSAPDVKGIFRGEVVYISNAEAHLPNLTVADTLYFAARTRAPRFVPGGVSAEFWAEHFSEVYMALYGITYLADTRVGDRSIHGLTDEERRRVSMAETALSGAPIQVWDNVTQGFDSGTVVDFCKILRLGSDLQQHCNIVSLYQAPEDAYLLFDKVLVIHEGRQLYFGKAKDARKYFQQMGFECSPKISTADFLTSVTSEAERKVQKSFAGLVPRTADQFADLWQDSLERQNLLREIYKWEEKFPVGGHSSREFAASRYAQQARWTRSRSAYILSFSKQVRLCLWREFQQLRTRPWAYIRHVLINTVLAIIIGSVFYNLPFGTITFVSREVSIFFMLLMSILNSSSEIFDLFSRRPAIEKHMNYALYHPSADALASVLWNIPLQAVTCTLTTIPFYFLSHLRRETTAFFFYLLISFSLMLTLSVLFRTAGTLAGSRSTAAIVSILCMLATIIYAGFALPVSYMPIWSSWIRHANPVYYAFSSLVINEFVGREFPCSQHEPGYGNRALDQQICTVRGSKAGESVVSGKAYIEAVFEIDIAAKWTKFAIICVFWLGLLLCYLIATEFVSAEKSRGEVIVFSRKRKQIVKYPKRRDEESLSDEATITSGRPRKLSGSSVVSAKQVVNDHGILHWQSLCYDVKRGGEVKRLLDHVDGWAKPGSLTALMGVSESGKTTLLNVLASRATIGLVSGDILVDGLPRNAAFQRSTGFVQQHDFHLGTSTVREAFTFSALLRQPKSTPRQAKLAYVEEVISLLDMEELADAIVGVAGEGLNVEQRKRVTIGVELAAKPDMLLFLDEPTTGLDSQTSWGICNLLRKLADAGQAVLCAVQEPSASLFQQFDRLLLLTDGGNTVYFGEIGDEASRLKSYFERHSAARCRSGENPAEWVMRVIGDTAGSKVGIDWHGTWKRSPEYYWVQEELERLKAVRRTSSALDHTITASGKRKPLKHNKFAASTWTQFLQINKRILRHYYRSPKCIYTKLALTILIGLFTGFSFYNTPNTEQGTQNQIFALFILFAASLPLIQISLSTPLTLTNLHHSRESPSSIFSPHLLPLSLLLTETLLSLLPGLLLYLTIFYPLGLHHTTSPSSTALFALLSLSYTTYLSTFSLTIALLVPSARLAREVSRTLWLLCLLFCGIPASAEMMPGFWVFVYRASPLRYFAEGMGGAALGGREVRCAEGEVARFKAPEGATCGAYMARWVGEWGGYVLDPEGRGECGFCSVGKGEEVLRGYGMDAGRGWRDLGVVWGFIGVNCLLVVGGYWVVERVKRRR